MIIFTSPNQEFQAGQVIYIIAKKSFLCEYYICERKVIFKIYSLIPLRPSGSGAPTPTHKF